MCAKEKVDAWNSKNIEESLAEEELLLECKDAL